MSTSTWAGAGFRLSPLHGVRVLELAGLAPVPHCGMVLADFGAIVTLVEKPGGATSIRRLDRGKRRVELDLKNPEDCGEVMRLASSSDVLLDPYRPGVLAKLGLDPVQLLQQNPGLIVCHLTGFGQSGPLASEAGHDINYVALSGLLPIISPRSPPWPPVNLLADFAGGGLTAAFGVLLALFQRASNGGRGCIIDVSMVEGLAYLGSFLTMYKDIDILFNAPFASFSSDCPIYRTYETKDGKFMSVGALEPKFTSNLFETLGLKLSISDVYTEPEKVVTELELTFKQKTRDEWTQIFKGKDACVMAVLDLDEVGEDAHHLERGTFQKDADGRWIPRRHPRLFTLEEYKSIREKSKL